MTPRLGSGRVGTAGVGMKAALLDRAKRAGLPVPEGVVVLDGDAGTGVEPPVDGGRSAVRSAFTAEDGASDSLAGRFETRLDVAPADLGAAVATVRASADRLPQATRRDVLVMRMVDARHAGVAFTERDFEDDRVEWVTGLAAGLVGGQVAGTELELGKLRRGERPRGDGPPFAGRLQALLRAIRHEFGEADWDVEWADDGAVCWLLQIRPVTRPIRRDEAFTVANHKEILPPLPSTFMTSLIASCADELFGWYRGFDPALPAGRPFIEVFRGRPFINLSLLRDMLRQLGLPTRLLVGAMGGEGDAGAQVALRPVRLVAKAPVLLRMGLAQLGALGSARRAIRRFNAPAASATTFGEAVDRLAECYVGLVTEMFGLANATGPAVAVLRAVGVLTELGGRHRTVATAISTDLEPLRRLAAAPRERAALEAGDLPGDPRFLRAWNSYLARHGHRGIYESDVARPRYRQDPSPLLAALLTPERPMPARRGLSPRARLWWPLWRLVAPVVAVREELRSAAMRTFERLRGDLLALAASAAEDGRLPGPDVLWLLTVDEIRRLDGSWRPGESFLDERRAQREDFAAYRFPDTFRRFDDLETFRDATDPPAGREGERRLRGVSLTDGRVRGIVWLLDEPSTARPETAERVVLVARSVDAGWIPTFARVDGVVVETGGDLSHGSIVLRELGLPAVTNVAGATRLLRDGDTVLLRAGEGVVVREASGRS